MAQFKPKVCEDLNAISDLKTAKNYHCEACVKSNDSWLHLRTCQTCGITLCCDSSVNKHASKHAASHKHPVVSSAEPNENWLWCYNHKTIKTY